MIRKIILIGLVFAIRGGAITEIPASDNGNAADPVTDDYSDRHLDEETREISELEFNTSFPFVVSLFTSDWKYKCAGTILNENWILTTKICVLGPNPVYFVRAHSRDFLKGGEIHEVEKSVPHNKPNDLHDIGLLRLKTGITNAKLVNPLGEDVPVFEGTNVQALGWGETSDGKDPRNLMMKNVPVSPRSKCQKLHPGDQWICTDDSPRAYLCKRDKGGPLMYQGKQLGVISHSYAKCGFSHLTASTDLRKYWKWVEDTMYGEEKSS